MAAVTTCLLLFWSAGTIGSKFGPGPASDAISLLADSFSFPGDKNRYFTFYFFSKMATSSITLTFHWGSRLLYPQKKPNCSEQSLPFKLLKIRDITLLTTLYLAIPSPWYSWLSILHNSYILDHLETVQDFGPSSSVVVAWEYLQPWLHTQLSLPGWVLAFPVWLYSPGSVP